MAFRAIKGLFRGMINYLVSIIGAVILCQSAWANQPEASTQGDVDLPSFTKQAWTDDGDRQVSLSDLESDFFVVSLFYTSCPNTCNMTLDKYAKLDKRLSGLGVNAKFILISLDPNRDSPAELSKYRQQRDLKQANWYFLNGTEKQVENTARHLGYDFMRLDDHVFHRMKIFILNRGGQVIDTITMKTDIDKLHLPMTESQNG